MKRKHAPKPKDAKVETPDVSFRARGMIQAGHLQGGLLGRPWPFARIDVTKQHLILSDTLFGIVLFSHTFTKAKIQSIEYVTGGLLTLRGTGIRIIHTLEDYPDHLIFWCRAEIVLAGITSTGFMRCKYP
jgi:hypothetical protein